MADVNLSDHDVRLGHPGDPGHVSGKEPLIEEQLVGVGFNLARHGIATIDHMGRSALDEKHLDEIAAGTVGGTLIDELVKRGTEEFFDEPIDLGADTTSFLALWLYIEFGPGKL